MDFILILVFVISIFGCHLRKVEDGSFIGIKQTSAINGIFVMLVFLSHFKQYISIEKYENYYLRFFDHMGQLIVVTFLFYSGYGIMFSLMNKQNYLNTVPLRFLKVLIHFHMALLIFFVGGLAAGVRLPISTYLLALIGWDTIGNSTWFIFAILCLYVFVYIAGSLVKNRYELLVVFVSILCILFIFLLKTAGKSDYWFNTVLCFPAGMFFALNITKIEQVFSKRILYFVSILISLGIILVCKKLSGHIGNHYVDIFLYEIKSIAFVWTIVSVTWILAICNPILSWLGGYVFEIYILQRIPMIPLENVAMNKYLYFIICLVVTLVMALVFKKVELYVDGIVNRKLAVRKALKNN